MIKNDITAGLGNRKSETAIVGGELVNVLTGEIYKADVAIYGSKIAFVGDVSDHIDKKTKVIDAKGKYLVPGFIDGHVHPESSLLSMTRFAETVLPAGTTSVMTSLDEYATVLGLPAIRYFLDETNKTPLKIFLVVPSRIPYIPWADTTGGFIGFKEIKKALGWRESVGIWETTFDLVLRFDREVMKGIEETLKRRQTVHGHCPMIVGNNLAGYLAAGIRSDHESFTKEEALEKLRSGLKVMLREGSVARQMSALVGFIRENKAIDTRSVSIITDDVDVEDLLNLGHVNFLVKKAVEEGIDPVKAIQMVSLNTAEAYRVDHLVGSIAPGKIADVLLVDDLKSFRVDSVIANGDLVAKNGKMLLNLKVPARPRKFVQTIHLRRKITPEMMTIRTKNPNARKVKVISMQVPPEIPIRLRREAVLKVNGGIIEPDTKNDVLYIEVVERYGKTRNIGKAFISGFNLNEGAMASSMAHDNHNIVVMGTNVEDMSTAVNHIAKIQGGQVVVKNGEVIDELHLPLCGIATDLPPRKLSERVQSLNKTVRELGCGINRPFMFLIFIPLAAIPEYAVTDQGFFDVKSQKFISPVIEEII